MRPFNIVNSIVVPLEKINVDTDQIIPKQFLKLVQRTGFGRYLFYDWRYKDGNESNLQEDFVLNDPKYKGATILIAGENFGCGSSREHAVWALSDYGFKVIIAPSFADIFYNNCFKNGVLAITLEYNQIKKILEASVTEIKVDLQNKAINIYKDDATSETIDFEIDSHRRTVLLEGLDEIAQTLEYNDKITEFEIKSSKRIDFAPPVTKRQL